MQINLGKKLIFIRHAPVVSDGLFYGSRDIECRTPTSAEIEITNNNYGNWSFDITGNDGTASISSELIGDDPIDIITKINAADIGITASFSENE